MQKESLSILVAQARSFLDRQWEAFESQDKKIAGLFGLATGLITIVPTIVSTFGHPDIGWKLVPFALSAAAYLGALPITWSAYRPSEINLIGNARQYYEGWLELSEEEVLRWTIFDLANRQDAKDLLLARKQTLLGYAAILVATEAVFPGRWCARCDRLDALADHATAVRRCIRRSGRGRRRGC